MNVDSYNYCSLNSSLLNDISNLSSLLSLIGEKNRLKILCILRKGEHCVCEIENHVKLSQSLSSHHLKDLKDSGIIKSRKKQLWVYYSLTQKGKLIVDKVFNLIERNNLNAKTRGNKKYY